MRCHANILLVPLASFIFLFTGCAGVPKIPPLQLPSSDMSNKLYSYNRYTFTGYQKTNQLVKKGDMILFFVSGVERYAGFSHYKFQMKIGNSPKFNPLLQNVGYFNASYSGKIYIYYPTKDSAGSTSKKALHVRVDVFVFPESAEPDIFDILRKIALKNPDDSIFKNQIEQFIAEYHWLVYAKIEIESSPGYANVYIDGERVGTTPLELDNINRHKVHNLCIRLDDYSDHCQSFSPMEKSRFDIALQKITTNEYVAEPESQKDKTPPVIDITFPIINSDNRKISLSDYTVKISGNVEDQNGVVWVKINGQDANLDANGKFWLTTYLAVGSNKIEIQALDTKNNLARKLLIVERSPIRINNDIKNNSQISESTENIDFGNYMALVIGNNSYTNLQKLKTAVNDAQNLANILKEMYGFTVELVLNGTRRQILFSLDRYRHKLTKNDNFLIYYAGHGYFDRDVNRGYWLPIDADTDTSAEWISNADITDKLKAIKAKHIMIIADSCYSGTLTRGIKVVSRDSDYLIRMSSKKARTVLTSGGLEPVLDSAGGQHSVFAKALLDALKNNTGVMDGTALFSIIRRPVMLNANQTPQYSDIRYAGHDGGEFLFVPVNN